jgi:predicted transport protein
MAKTSGEFEQEFIDTAKEKTGKSLSEWLKFVKHSGMEKRNDIMEWLKRDQGLNHMQAQFVTGIFLNHGKPVYINENALLENQFLKCPDMRPHFDAIAESIRLGFPGTDLIPKKTYISFTASREFAAVNVKPGEVILGLDLGDMPFTDKVLKSKLTGPMPRISHMVILRSPADLDNNLMTLLQISYNQTNVKK